MTMRRPPVLAGPHLAGLIAFGLVALGVWPWLVQNQPAPAKPPTANPVAVPAFPVLPPLVRFAGVVERPLFSPSRRPDKAAPTAASSGDLAARYRLIGIVTEDDVRHAWLIENGRRFEIAEGDRLASARVGRIDADRVVLLSGGGETVLQLRPTPAEPTKSAEPAKASEPQR